VRGAAIVTGARGGLGRAIAEALAADGHPLVAVIRAPDAAVDAWAARLPSPAVVACVDLAQSGAPALTPAVAAPAPLEAALSAALDGLGAAPAIVVHAAGAAERGAITEAAPGAVARAVSVHADALVALARVLDERGASTTVADRGRIVALGLAGVERLGGYRAWPVQAAAKAAQLVVARSLALTLAPRGITVNVVAPGHVDAGAGVAPEVVARIPAGRPGAPADVVAAVRYLLSPGAAYVTGAVIPVAGGFAL
jgi:3-oxoacyl-[acyl-carrier protein] reductase